MAVNMNMVNGYGAYQSNYKSNSVKEKKAEKTDKKEYVTNGQKALSKDAQALLEKLRATYTDKDFMVADFDKGDDAREILARGTKEFSVLFSSDELEKMAKDEKYYNEKMAAIDGAVRMSKEINEKYGFEALGEKGEIMKIGISFNSDGTTTLFAELEKTSAKQSERIEKAKQEKLEDKKAEGRKEKTKKATVWASSMEELLEKMNQIDWSKVKEKLPAEGSRFDYSI